MAEPETVSLAARLRALAESWLHAAAGRRKEADAEADKVWSARQYGIADTYEDAALHVRQVLAHSVESPGEPPDWDEVISQWRDLSQQVLALAESDDNRITVAYRRSGAEAYLKAIDELRAVLEGDAHSDADALNRLIDSQSG